MQLSSDDEVNVKMDSIYCTSDSTIQVLCQKDRRKKIDKAKVKSGDGWTNLLSHIRSSIGCDNYEDQYLKSKKLLTSADTVHLN